MARPTRSKKFNESEEVTLALAVEQYPTLWDCTLESYRRADLKPQLWSKVAAEVGPSFTVDDVSKRFKNMRDTFSTNYRKVRESQKKCSGSSVEDVFVPTWFLYKYLQYLIKTCAQAESTSNLERPQHSLTQTVETITPVSQNSVLQPMYYDNTMKQFYVIPEDLNNLDSDNQSDWQSDFSLQSGDTNSPVMVVPGPSSMPSTSSSAMFVTPKRPASAPSAGEPACKSTPSEDHFFNKKGSTKKGNSSLLQSAVSAMEKIAAESAAPISIPQSGSKASDFAIFVSNRLDALDPSERKLCENEILQVILKY